MIYEDLLISNSNIDNNYKNELETNQFKQTTALLYYFMGKYDENWSHFEEDLAKIPLKEFVSNFQTSNLSANKKLEPILGSPIKKEVDILTKVFSKIPKLFAKWIASLSKKDINKGPGPFENKIIKDINKDDIFIIFNYTKTLENNLNIRDTSNMFHIHGIFENEKSIIVGHNCKEKSKFTNLCDEEEYIEDVYATLYKNPEKVIKRNSLLWNKLTNLTDVDIYEFGWSCSGVDADYIKKIVSCLNSKNVHLYLNNFDNQGEFKKKQWVKLGMNENKISFYIEENENIIFD